MIPSQNALTLALVFPAAQSLPIQQPREEERVPLPPADKILFLSKTPGSAPDGDWELFLTADEGTTVSPLSDNSDRTIAWVDALAQPGQRATVVWSTKNWGAVFDEDTDQWVDSDSDLNNAVNGPMQAIHVASLQHGSNPPVLGAPSTLVDVTTSQGFGLARLWHPTLAPRGSGFFGRIVFAAAFPGEQMNLWTMNLDGSGLQRLIDQPLRISNDPSWGVDGWVYYVHSQQEGDVFQVWNSLDIWRVHPRAGVPERVTREESIPGPPRANSDPVLSPDGRLLMSLRNDETVWSSVCSQAPDGADWAPAQRHINPWRRHGVVHFEDSNIVLGERWTDCFLGFACDHQLIRFRADQSDGPVQVLWSARETGVEAALPVPF